MKYNYVVAPNCTVPILNNGNITWRGLPVSAVQVPKGSILTYKCDVGFIPNFAKLICGADGLLDGGISPPHCSGTYIFYFAIWFNKYMNLTRNKTLPTAENFSDLYFYD